MSGSLSIWEQLVPGGIVVSWKGLARAVAPSSVAAACLLVGGGCGGTDVPLATEGVKEIKEVPPPKQEGSVKQGGPAKGSSGGMNFNPGGSF